MENTKEEILIQRKGLNLERLKFNFKKYKVVYYFFMILSLLILLDFILIKKFIELASYAI